MKFLIPFLFLSSSTVADVRYYVEYKNDQQFIDNHYIDNSATNNLRSGIQGQVFYIEAGPMERAGEVGVSYETGYKYKFNSFEFKGKYEGNQLDNFEGQNKSKFETEIRYYFN